MIIKYKGLKEKFYWNKGLTIDKEYTLDEDHIFQDDNGKNVMYVPEVHEYFALTGKKQDKF